MISCYILLPISKHLSLKMGTGVYIYGNSLMVTRKKMFVGMLDFVKRVLTGMKCKLYCTNISWYHATKLLRKEETRVTKDIIFF